jgi:outer membrane protein
MMKTLTRTIASAAVIAALADASFAVAQTKPAAPAAKPAASAARPAAAAAAQPSFELTATTPGLCILSREAILGASTVGKYVQTRLGQLQSQANAELTGEGSSIQAAAKDLDAKKTTLGDAAFQQQRSALQQRADALQEKAQQRDRELQATEQKAIKRVLDEATPLVAAEAKAKNCSVVLDGNAVMAVNGSMNLTPNVITGLNGKLTQFDFEREHLDAQQAAQQR